MQHWTDLDLDGRDFRDEDLAGLRTERCVFTGCDFGGANLAESVHLGSAFRNCRFLRTALWHSTFRNCSLLGSTFEDCRLRPIVLDEVDFTLAVLAGADLRGVDLSGCRLRETSLIGADLRTAVRLIGHASKLRPDREIRSKRDLSAVSASIPLPCALEPNLPAHQHQIAHAQRDQHPDVEPPRRRVVLPPVVLGRQRTGNEVDQVHRRG